MLKHVIVCIFKTFYIKYFLIFYMLKHVIVHNSFKNSN
jgi:hypothetical protein